MQQHIWGQTIKKPKYFKQETIHFVLDLPAPDCVWLEHQITSTKLGTTKASSSCDILEETHKKLLLLLVFVYFTWHER